MEERHMHFTITAALFILVVYIVGMSAVKFGTNKWLPNNPVTNLVNYVTGH